MATITDDSLSWYGIDEHEGSVHDVIGTRCDPYTNNLLSGGQYHRCCHSNLTRAFSACPGGDCSSEHSSDSASCYPLLVEVFAPQAGLLDEWDKPSINAYDQTHGAD